MSATRFTRSSISVLGHSTRPQTERNVAEHGHVRIERVVLEHHRDIAVARAHVIDDLAADLDLPGVGVLEPGDRAQKRALAAAGRSDQHGELAVRDVEIDASDGVNRSVALVKGADSDVRHAVRSVHPLIAPRVSPRTRWRWTSMPRTMEGTRDVVASAQASPYCAP